MEKINKEVIDYMARKRVDKEAWIGPDIKIDTETHGYEFKVKEFVTGLILFGGECPLKNLDVLIDDHLKIHKIIRDIPNHGFVQQDVAGSGKSYLINTKRDFG